MDPTKPEGEAKSEAYIVAAFRAGHRTYLAMGLRPDDALGVPLAGVLLTHGAEPDGVRRSEEEWDQFDLDLMSDRLDLWVGRVPDLFEVAGWGLHVETSSHVSPSPDLLERAESEGFLPWFCGPFLEAVAGGAPGERAGKIRAAWVHALGRMIEAGSLDPRQLRKVVRYAMRSHLGLGEADRKASNREVGEWIAAHFVGYAFFRGKQGLRVGEMRLRDAMREEGITDLWSGRKPSGRRGSPPRGSIKGEATKEEPPLTKGEKAKRPGSLEYEIGESGTQLGDLIRDRVDVYFAEWGALFREAREIRDALEARIRALVPSHTKSKAKHYRAVREGGADALLEIETIEDVARAQGAQRSNVSKVLGDVRRDPEVSTLLARWDRLFAA